jgi:hypothetical protein
MSMKRDPRPSAVAVLAAEAVVAGIAGIEAAGAEAVAGAIGTNRGFCAENLNDLALTEMRRRSVLDATQGMRR